jgi:hypothetical protein
MRKVFITALFASFLFCFSCNRSANILSIIENRVIFTEYGFGGSSYELIHENNKDMVLEKIYKSGLNDYYSTKYDVDAVGRHDIKFHNVLETNNPVKSKETNTYSIQLGKNNRFELIVNNKIYFETSRKNK